MNEEYYNFIEALKKEIKNIGFGKIDVEVEIQNGKIVMAIIKNKETKIRLYSEQRGA